jgi:hypothetical protein
LNKSYLAPTISEARYLLREMLEALEMDDNEQYWRAFDALSAMHRSLGQRLNPEYENASHEDKSTQSFPFQGSATSSKTLTPAMDNTLAWKLGEIALDAGDRNRNCGDPIDRGLILLRLLQENGFALSYKFGNQFPLFKISGEIK